MTSSLTHQTSGPQRSFLSAPFFPLDLNHSTLYSLYAGTVGNTNCINQLVQSANLFGIKDLHDAESNLHGGFSLPPALPSADGETGIKSTLDGPSLTFPLMKTTPATHELLGPCDLGSQQSGSSSRAEVSIHDLSTHGIGSCDSDGSVSSSHSVTNEQIGGLRTSAHESLPNEKKRKELVRDEAYWERRRKNNDAAKRSRDSRRRKEDEVAVRAALLEQENLRLRFEVERLRTEIERHRIVALNSKLVAHNPFVGAALQATP